jgi:hypothetical protein
MPFKSKAQRRKFAQLLVEGKITPEVFEEWNRETGGTLLPERVKRKSSAKKSRARKRKPPKASSTRSRSRPARRRTKRKTSRR